MNRRNFLSGLFATASGLVLPHEPKRVYSFGEDVGRPREVTVVSSISWGSYHSHVNKVPSVVAVVSGLDALGREVLERVELKGESFGGGDMSCYELPAGKELVAWELPARVDSMLTAKIDYDIRGLS